tara:strand:+ start:376 stop:525 length:150 start_codon:yes stop_codon:yes gene_type:complete
MYEMLKTLYYGKKYFLLFSLLALALFVVGCSTQAGSPPPSGPVGGGCGG